MITIAYIRDSDVITDAMLASYVAAQQIQITRDFAPLWGIDATCQFVLPGTTIPASAYQVWFKDHSDQAGDLGYHDVDGNPIAYVFTADDLADKVSWSITGSHETLEMLADPQINQVRDIGGIEYPLECADACEDDSFGYVINGHTMTDFVLQSWFDLNGKAPFTFRNSISGPLQLALGGYIGQRVLPNGQWTQKFAEGVPVTARQNKRPTSRTLRRFAK